MIDEPPFITKKDMMGNLKNMKELKAAQDELTRRMAAYHLKYPNNCLICGAGPLDRMRVGHDNTKQTSKCRCGNVIKEWRE